MISSKLSRKRQRTIPLPVRTVLHLAAGDVLAYAVDGDRVIVTKAGRVPSDDPFATFSEWSSAADTRGYGDL